MPNSSANAHSFNSAKSAINTENALYAAWIKLPPEERYQVDQKAFHNFRKTLLRHASCVLWMVCKERSKDIIEEMVIQIFRSLPKFQGRSRFSSWAHSVFLRLAYWHRRKVRLRKESPLRLAASIEAPSTTDNQQLLQELIEALPPKDKAFMLDFLAGFTRKEMAQKYGLPDHVVKYTLRRITETLKNNALSQ